MTEAPKPSELSLVSRSITDRVSDARKEWETEPDRYNVWQDLWSTLRSQHRLTSSQQSLANVVEERRGRFEFAMQQEIVSREAELRSVRAVTREGLHRPVYRHEWDHMIGLIENYHSAFFKSGSNRLPQDELYQLVGEALGINLIALTLYDLV